MSLTSKQRAALRGAANTMDPVYQIGKGEIDETLKQGIADCIAARELIKIKVLENSEYDPARPPTSCARHWTATACRSSAASSFFLSRRKRRAPTPPCSQNENHALRRDL